MSEASSEPGGGIPSGPPGRAAPGGTGRGSPSWLLATFFGAGLVPVASGTFATLATIPLYLLLYFGLGPNAVLVAALVVSAAGVMAAGAVEKSLGLHDPSEVVIDEVAGFLVTMLFIAPTLASVAAGFFLFRALDVLKPWPASRAEKLPGGWGIMADDLVCGLVANLVIHAGIALWR